MWEEEQDFEILEEVEEYNLSDDTNDDLLFPELDSTTDENENSDVFEYEANFYYDEEDE
jgi:hypothetical protein